MIRSWVDGGSLGCEGDDGDSGNLAREERGVRAAAPLRNYFFIPKETSNQTTIVITIYNISSIEYQTNVLK